MIRKPEYQLPPDPHSQQSLPTLGPQPGQHWQSIHSNIMLTVLEVKPGRRTWLKVRLRDSVSDMQLGVLSTYWRPYDGPGVKR